nr:immunoglobulin heavy chain junction region [Macaca mulatta]
CARDRNPGYSWNYYFDYW